MKTSVLTTVERINNKFVLQFHPNGEYADELGFFIDLSILCALRDVSITPSHRIPGEPFSFEIGKKQIS